MNFTRINKKAVLASLWLILTAAMVFGQTPGAKTEPVVELKLNESLERELSGGQTQTFSVALKAGEFTQVQVEQKGIDVLLSINSADGAKLAEMDSLNGKYGWETLSLIAQTAGTYRVKITRLEEESNSAKGNYSVVLQQKHIAAPTDQERISAERLYDEGRILYERKKYAEAEIKFAAVIPIWQKLDDKYLEAMSLRYLSWQQTALKKFQESIATHEKELAIYQLLKLRREEADTLGSLGLLYYQLEDYEKSANYNEKSAAIYRELNDSASAENAAKSAQEAAEIKARQEKDAKRKAAVERRKAAEGERLFLPHLVVPTGHTSGVFSVAFSADGKTLASSGGLDNIVKLWNIETGQELKTLTGHTYWVESVAFSPNGKTLASGSRDNTVKLWNVETGQELKTLTGHTYSVDSVAFSPDGKTLASGNGDKTIKLWNVETGQELKTLTGHTNPVESVAFSPNGKTLASGSLDKTVKLWNVETGQELKSLTGHTNSVYSVAFSPDGKTLASGSLDKTVKLWSVETGQELKTLTGHTREVRSVAFSADGKTLASGNGDKTIKLWNIETGQELKTLTGHTNPVESVAFSPNGKTLASGSLDKTVKLWNVETGQELKTLTGHTSEVILVAFSADGKTLASGNGDKTIKLWNIETGQELKTLTGHTYSVDSVAFSPDGKTLASGNGDKTIKLWNIETGQELKTLTGHTREVILVAFSPDGKTLASGSLDKTVKLWSVETGQELKTLTGHTREVYSVAFSPDGRTLASRSYDKTIKLWNVETGQEIKYGTLPEWAIKTDETLFKAPNGKLIRADTEGGQIVLRDVGTEDDILTLTALDKTEWVVVDPDGRWDASPGAQKLMYYVLSTPEGYETIDFSQLKERYYEPNLLQKVLGYSKEQVRDVAQFKDVLLPPAVEPIAPKDEKSTVRQVKLRNRSGGIGRVQVFVNGREFIEDARDAKLKANPQAAEYVLSFDLKNASFIAGQKPDVKVVAWNYDAKAKEQYKGYISSRGTEIVYLADKNQNVAPPTLYAIVGGVSDYQGSALDLRFAAKDADDIYRAIQVGGKNLFGVERMKLQLLSTSGNKDAILPTKANFQKTFAEFAAEAKPNDILFVYLSGHGITLNFGSDTYYYLTQEAATTDKEILSKDNALLSSSTISSEELTQMHKAVKAQKQVLILDTCAAGALGNEFKIVEKKELSTDAKRALEKMRDRVSFHVLMGSAANAVSYEASQYGQGLLTYSLLQGMKGAALETDGQIDVSKLFNYAADTVPNLAKNIGGIQRPEIRVPIGGTSFPFGIIKTDDDKKQIPLAQVKPVILRPNFQNQKLSYDNLKIAALLRDALREANFTVIRGDTNGGLVFVDTDEMPDAIVPAGNYQVEGDAIKVTVNLIKNNEPAATFTVEGSKNDLAALTKKMVETIETEAQRAKR